MTPPRFHLKHPAGWFAAGSEVQQALTLLSDAGFKLFVWLCLHAERSTGSLSCSPAQLAGALGRSEAELQASVQELVDVGVAQWVAEGVLEIQDRFWPYERARRSETAAEVVYVAEVRRLFLRPACVRSMFSAADARLAAQWGRDGISLVCVERAILLGSLRKLEALLNRAGGTPITSLHYFVTLLEEVQQSPVGADYWRYLASKLPPLEHQWRQFCAAQRARADETMETK